MLYFTYVLKKKQKLLKGTLISCNKIFDIIPY
jgi:hypothetical protein